MFLSEVNNVESEELSGAAHTAAVALSVSTTGLVSAGGDFHHSGYPGHMGSSSSSEHSGASAGSSSATATSATTTTETCTPHIPMDVDVDNITALSSGLHVDSADSAGSAGGASVYLRPLSTATGMVQYLAAAHWSGIMKRVLSVQNDELHAASLYAAAVSICANNSHTNITTNSDRNDDRNIDRSTDRTKVNDDESAVRVIPLMYELCTRSVSSSQYPEGAHDLHQLRQYLSSTSFDSISDTMRARGTNGGVSPSHLGEYLTDLSQYVVDNASHSSHNANSNSNNNNNNNSNNNSNSINNNKNNHTQDRKANHIEIPSQLSLQFCLAVDESLHPQLYALLCSRTAGSTLFLAPVVIDATSLTMPMTPFDDARCSEYPRCSMESNTNLIVRGLENALGSALNWARNRIDSTAKLSYFGLYAARTGGQVVSKVSKVSVVVAGRVEAPLSNRCSTVLWCDSGCLIAIQFNSDSCKNDKNDRNERNDENALQLSLLCPIPLPGVGTLGPSGPPTCIIGIPRNVTSDEVDRMKRRCISIGEVSLTIVGNNGSNNESNGNNGGSNMRNYGGNNSNGNTSINNGNVSGNLTKKQRLLPASYSFCCGEFSHLEAFTVASGLVPTPLYSSLARELLQHTLCRYPFSPTEIPEAHKHAPNFLSLSLNTSGEERNNVLYCLRSAYSSVRPLLEFILLASSYAAMSEMSSGTGRPVSRSSSGGGDSSKSGVMSTCNGVLKVLSLDCVSRAEPFIVCALYENTAKDTSTKSDDSDDEDEEETDPESAVEKRLIGFIEVEIMKSAMDIVQVPDTPRTPRTPGLGENVRSDSIIEETTGKIEKVYLNVSSLLSNFDDQTVEMEIFRECFQKKLQAMSGRNQFHAFINKLISFFAAKKI